MRCWVKSLNERNPYPVLDFHRRLPGTTGRKVGMMSNQHGFYVSGYTHATMASTKGREAARF